MDKFQQYLGKIRNLLNLVVFRILLFIVLSIVLFGAMYGHVKPEKLNLELFRPAPTTIRSPVTVTDKELTDKKKNEAEAQVSDQYVLNQDINENRVDLITSIFDAIIDVQRDIEEERGLQGELLDSGETFREPSVSEKLERLKRNLTDDIFDEISDITFIALLNANPDEVEIVKKHTVTAVNKTMKNNISADKVENAKKDVEEELKGTNLQSNLKRAAIELGRYAIVQNEFFDVEKTQELKQQARDSVEPVRILQGQVIVEENQLISREIYRQLGLVGLLEDSETSPLPFIGLLLFITIMLGAVYYYFHGLDIGKETKQNFILMYSIVFILSIALMKGISFIQLDYSELGYLFPAAMAPILIKILIDERLALLTTVILAFSGSVIFNEGITGSFNLHVALYILGSGISGVLYLSKRDQRSKILRAGVFVTFINIIIIFSLVFIQNAQYGLLEYTFYFVAAAISGMAAAVLTIGLLPFLETGFGVLSTMRLIELSNPNHPLLKKILTEAPGTYHHSVMVANLSEAACEAIGANGLLARVGCYYHDIGKTRRPQFFIENQMNMENPHDRLPPQTSKNIIISHATDGAEILRKYKMPKEIIDIAEQHHGTTFLKYFYHKAKESGLDVTEDDFRYPGPKPQTKEAAIIGIADSVEAAVRSMNHPNMEQIERLIRNIIADRLNDGQLNECDITLKELEMVAQTLYETLKGIFHSRIEYPETNIQKVKEA